MVSPMSNPITSVLAVPIYKMNSFWKNRLKRLAFLNGSKEFHRRKLEDGGSILSYGEGCASRTGDCGLAAILHFVILGSPPKWLSKSIKWIMPNPLQFFCVEGEVYKMHFLLWIPTLRQKGGSL